MMPKTSEVPGSVLLVFVDPVLVPPAQPYGAQILAETLAEIGVTAKVIWPHLTSDPIRTLDDEVRRMQPRLIGFSFRNLDTASVDSDRPGSFARLLEDYVRTVRGRAVTVLGGSGFSIDPLRLLRASGADIGFVGPAEYDFATFCQRVLQGQSIIAAASGLSNVVLPDMQKSPRPTPQQLGKPTALHPNAVLWARIVGGTIPVRTKTGCSLRCSYCVVPFIEPTVYRAWEDIESELVAIAAAGLGERVFIADGEFNLPDPERAHEIALRIRKRFGGALRWRCYLEAGHIPTHLPQALRDAGCFAVSLTVDSLADGVRRRLGKRSTASQAMDGAAACIEAGLTTYGNLLFGCPGETLATIDESLQNARHLLSRGITLFVATGLRVYPGTPLARIARQPDHRQFTEPDAYDTALAGYSSPMSSRELRTHLKAKLPAGPSIVYLPVPIADDEFYADLAAGIEHLATAGPVAVEHFTRLAVTDRREAKLARLLVEQQQRQLRSSPWPGA